MWDFVGFVAFASAARRDVSFRAARQSVAAEKTLSLAARLATKEKERGNRKREKGIRGAADEKVTRIGKAECAGTRRGTHHPRGDERGERDGLLRRRASLRVEIAGRDRGQSMGGDARAIRRARKDRTGRRSDLTQRSTETPRSTRRSPRARARTWPVLPMISTLSPLGTALTMPCIHPAPVATMVVVGGSESVPRRGGGVPFRCRRVERKYPRRGRRRIDATEFRNHKRRFLRQK